MQGWMILILGWGVRALLPVDEQTNWARSSRCPTSLKTVTPRNRFLVVHHYVDCLCVTKVSVTAFTGGIFLEKPPWSAVLVWRYRLDRHYRCLTVLGGMKGVMTLSAIQTPILIIGSFLVLFLGLAALGGGSIADGWTAMIDYSKTLNVGADGVAHGPTTCSTSKQANPMYDDTRFLGVHRSFHHRSLVLGYDQHIVQRVLGQRKVNPAMLS
jgi:SSS family solute:Na+ symporter